MKTFWSYRATLVKSKNHHVETLKTKEEVIVSYKGKEFVLVLHPPKIADAKIRFTEEGKLAITEEGLKFISLVLEDEHIDKPVFTLDGGDSSFGEFRGITVKVLTYAGKPNLAPIPNKVFPQREVKVPVVNASETKIWMPAEDIDPSSEIMSALAEDPDGLDSGFIEWFFTKQETTLGILA